jgi:hypothetical protein
LFSQVLMIAAEAGLGRFGTVAIDGTKIAANASIDANRGKEWFDQHVAGMVADSEDTDRAEDITAGGAHGVGPDRVPPGLGDRTRRAERIHQAAHELGTQLQRRARVDEDRQAVAVARRRRSEQGQPVVGRIPDGPHRLPEARAHLAREIATHQAKLDRYAAFIAAGRKPMGRRPVPMEDSTRVARARRVVRNAETAERVAAVAESGLATESKRLPKVVANTTDPQSRIMPTRKGFLQGYNAQVAVTGDQLIIAVQVGQSTNDQACFLPMMRAAQHAATRIHAATGNTDHVIGTVLADAGYNSDANLTATGPDRLIALGKGRDQARAALTSLPRVRHRPMRLHERPTGTGCARRRAERYTSGAAQRSSPASATSRESSTGSLAAAWTTRPTNYTWQPPHSTSRRSTEPPQWPNTPARK